MSPDSSMSGRRVLISIFVLVTLAVTISQAIRHFAAVTPQYKVASAIRPVPGYGACVQVNDKTAPRSTFIVCAQDENPVDATGPLNYSCHKIIANGYATVDWKRYSCAPMIVVAAKSFQNKEV